MMRVTTMHVGLCCVVALITACTSAVPESEPVATYALDAKGRAAVVDEAVPLSWQANESAGLILSADLCEGKVYLFGPGVKSAQVADLARGRVEGRIGQPGNGPGDLRRPVSMGVDCRNRKLYFAEGPGGILAFDLETGAYLTTYSHPSAFKASMGSRLLVSRDGGRLFLSGLWPANRDGFDRQPAKRMYADSNLGLALDLVGEGRTRITGSYEQGCSADPTACLDVQAEPLADGAGWVVAQGGATRVGVFSATSELSHTIDVRSPEFLRDGSSPGTTTERQMKWNETNNSIQDVYAFRDAIAVVHSRHATKNWHRGQIVQFDVFMNVYTRDGGRLVSDIRLPDLPVGRDESHILVIDYGATGRRSNATEVRLLKIRVRPGADGFTSEL